MRRFFLAACFALGVLAVAPSVFAATVQEIQAALATSTDPAATLAQYATDPNLSAGLAAAVEANPALAQTYVTAADGLTGANANAVQQAVGTGLANAASVLASQGTSSGTSNAETVISAINSSTSTAMIASAAASISPTAGALAGTNTALANAITALNATGNTTTSCVSPSRPGPC